MTQPYETGSHSGRQRVCQIGACDAYNVYEELVLGLEDDHPCSVSMNRPELWVFPLILREHAK